MPCFFFFREYQPLVSSSRIGASGKPPPSRTPDSPIYTSLYANVELRLVLLPIQLLVPGELGVFIAADAGRVFFAEAPNETDTWHRSVGGGFWLSFFQRRQTLSVAVVDGDDLTGVYLRAGFMF